MSARTAFLAGWMASNAVLRIAVKVANSDTNMGKEVRRNLLAHMDHDQLLRRAEETKREIARRNSRTGRIIHGDAE